MRMYQWVAVSFLTVVTACGSGDAVINSSPPGNYSAGFWGEVTGTRNGVPMWNPRVSGDLYPYKPVKECDKETFAMYITEFDNSGCERLALTFQGMPRTLDTVRNFQPGHLFTRCYLGLSPLVNLYLTECDAQIGSYIVDSTRQSQILIKSFDGVTGEVSGSFKINFLARQKPSPSIINNPQDRYYYEAEFKTKLRQEGQTSYQ